MVSSESFMRLKSSSQSGPQSPGARGSTSKFMHMVAGRLQSIMALAGGLSSSPRGPEWSQDKAVGFPQSKWEEETETEESLCIFNDLVS